MTKDDFLAPAASRYDDLQRLNTERTHFYDYEKGFAELWTEDRTGSGSPGRQPWGIA
ncbi:MAG: hypothetical protein P9E88_07620 [Candidatus Competibacter sp.]|nr:hypothetical protein [Candidatus Competibacter sp.]